jgi:undecaprenyl-diphosphatase
MEYLRIAVLALIQGAAELLPVSSSAHVIVAETLMGMDPSSKENVFLLVMLHTGTMFAVLFYFWPRWHELLFPPVVPERGRDWGPALHFLGLVLLATACSGILGLGLLRGIEKVTGEEVEMLFKDLVLVAVALLAAGLFIIAAGFWKGREDPAALNFRSAVVIGIVQALCIPFRGFSRSGATISTALFCNVPRARAEDFSFALAVALTPPALGRTLLRLLRSGDLSGSEIAVLLLPGLVGMVFAFLAGLVALKFLSRVLEQGGWRYFGYYCVAAAAAILAAYQAGLLQPAGAGGAELPPHSAGLLPNNHTVADHPAASAPAVDGSNLDAMDARRPHDVDVMGLLLHDVRQWLLDDLVVLADQHFFEDLHAVGAGRDGEVHAVADLGPDFLARPDHTQVIGDLFLDKDLLLEGPLLLDDDLLLHRHLGGRHGHGEPHQDQTRTKSRIAGSLAHRSASS